MSTQLQIHADAVVRSIMFVRETFVDGDQVLSYTADVEVGAWSSPSFAATASRRGDIRGAIIVDSEGHAHAPYGTQAGYRFATVIDIESLVGGLLASAVTDQVMRVIDRAALAVYHRDIAVAATV